MKDVAHGYTTEADARKAKRLRKDEDGQAQAAATHLEEAACTAIQYAIHVATIDEAMDGIRRARRYLEEAERIYAWNDLGQY